MADVEIIGLPAAGTITGTELVPVVQNGLTVQTTVSAITQSPSLTQTFLTVGQQTGLPNSRYFSTGTGLGFTDGGAQGPYTIALNGSSGSLEGAGTGVIVKSAANTIVARSLVSSGNGLNVTNGDGIAGNPIFALTGLAQAIANASGTGLLALGSGTTLSPVTLTGTGNQIGVTGGDGSSTPTISLAANLIAPGTAGITLPNGTTAQRGATTGQIRYNTDTARFEGYYVGSWQTFGIGDGTVTSVSGTTNQINVNNVGSIATVALSSNPIVPGNGGFVVPIGTTAQRNPSPTNGTLRYNSSLGLFEGYANGVWGAITTGSGVTSVATGTGLTGGPITSTGTISIANTAVTAAAYGSSYQVPTFTVNAQGQLTLASNTTIDAVTLTTGSITTTPSGANDIVNKSYVDSVAQGLDAKASCVVATTANITLSGEQTIDGVTTSSSRVLVKNQGTSSQNGIYVSSSGAWTRALDMDVWAEVPDSFTFIETGTTQADTGWVCTANQGGTIGVTAMPWTQFSGAGTYTAGTGLTLTGTQFSITNTAVTAASYGSATAVGTFTVNAQGQLTLAGNTTITPAVGSITGLGTGVATALGVNVGSAGAFVVNGGALGTPSSGTVTNLTGTASININGTVGATTASTGDFTTLNSSGNTRLGGLSGNQSLQVNNVASAVNYLQAVGAVTTGAPILSVQGTDANISLPIISKGTGAIDLVAGSSGVNISNGGTVTAIARTAPGGGYVSIPTAAISAPTTAGGVQATADVALEPATFSIISGGTGYAVSDILEFTGGTFYLQRTRLSVTSVSAGVITGVTISIYGRYTVLPTSPNSVTTITGTGSGASISITGSTFFSANITNAGSGYVEQPTVTFSGGGGGTGAAAYAIIGSNTTIKSLGTNLLFNTPGGNQVIIGDSSAVTTDYVYITGSAFGRPVITARPISGTNVSLGISGTGVGGVLQFMTNNTAQVQAQVNHTASAVNYLALTGAATGAAPTISAAGSDANINLALTAKGTGNINLSNGSGLQVQINDSGGTAVNYFSFGGSISGGTPAMVMKGSDANVGVSMTSKGTGNYIFWSGNFARANALIASVSSSVNYLQLAPAVTTSAPELSAQGSDTNINLNLTPKGTGSVTINATTAITVPAGTTAQRPTGVTGMFRYNSTTAGFEGYNGTTWGAIGGGSNITTLGLWENASVIAANYTIGTGNNATSAGPITINSGVVVTVPSGSTWVVV